jgi:hypothetical protein
MGMETEQPSISGNGEFTLPAIMSVPPTEAQSYLTAGRHLLNGVKALVDGSQDSLWALSFLASQALECLLKAYLSSQVIPEKAKLKDSTLRHNLEGLWNMAEKNHLGVGLTVPDWCLELNSLHNTPYKIRYPMGLNGMGFPEPRRMMKELEDLSSIVRKKIEG